MKPVFILMVTYKRLDYLRQTIASLLPTMPLGAKLGIVDNDSSGAAYDYLRVVCAQHENVEVLLSDKNLGMGGAVNEGLRVFPEWKEYEYTMLINNDETFEPDWFEKSKAIMEKHTKIGLLGLWRHIHHGTIQELTDIDIRDNAPGVAWFFRTDDLERFLPYTEKGSTTIVGGNGEDVSMTHKVMDAGMWVAAPKQDLAHHIEGYKTDMLGQVNPEYL